MKDNTKLFSFYIELYKTCICNSFTFYQNLYKKNREGGNKKQKQKNYQNNKRKFDRQHSEQQPPKKKPLLDTPMDERPVCRFYKEGKCHKVRDQNYDICV